MRSLVTGGLGFVGSNLVDILINSGDEVFILDDLSSESSFIENQNEKSNLIIGKVEDINKYFPNMILIFEAIKALHLQTLGAPHPLQEFALKNVAILETDEDGTTTGGLKSTLLDELGVDKDEDL